jgi:hypothetical protein
VSTASRNCRFHLQRLQVLWLNAPNTSESFGGGPWALRPKRLQWLTNITDEFKIAAFLSCASSLMALHTTQLCNCGLEALAGTSPPFLFFKLTHGPPRLTPKKSYFSHPFTPWLANGWLGVIGRWLNSK